MSDYQCREPHVAVCPRCGSDEVSHGWSAPPMQGHVECHADECGALAVAGDEDAALALWNGGYWNYRIVGRDEDGSEVIEAHALAALEPKP